MPSTRIVLAGVLTAAVVGAGATWALADPGARDAAPDAAPVVDPATAARTSFPGLTPATGEPTLPGLRSATPRPGAVDRLAGPFDDRFTWQRLRLEPGAVTGAVDVTSDVSDILELQVVAGFYDRDGRFLGLGRFTHHLVEESHHDSGPPSEEERFHISAPARIRDRVASASVGVPVLVNE